MKKTSIKLKKPFLICNIIFIIILFQLSFTVCGFSQETNQNIKIRYPLIFADGIVVDKLNNIYIGEKFFGVLQVYDKYGTYKYSIKIDALDGDFKVFLDKDGNVNVSTARNNRLFVYNNWGKLINVKKNDYSYEKLTSSGNTFLSNENKYVLNRAFFIIPYVTKTNNKGGEQILISESITYIMFRIIFALIIVKFIMFGIKLKNGKTSN